MRLENKRALVTGAGQGIGEAIAIRLSTEGCDVAVADINGENAESTAAAVRGNGQKSVAVAIDLSRVDGLEPMVDLVVGELGGLDILVNCAGIVQTKPLLEISEQDWDTIIDINQKGLFFCMQAGARRMVKQVEDAGGPEANVSAGKIVNLSSISGRRGRAMQTPYAATKAAIISLTQSAALALAPYNINVNAVAPSVVLTPMWDKIAADRGKLSGAGSGATVESFVEKIPLNRTGTTEEIAAAVAFLCSSEADYITGQCLNVDGGFEMD